MLEPINFHLIGLEWWADVESHVSTAGMKPLVSISPLFQDITALEDRCNNSTGWV